MPRLTASDIRVWSSTWLESYCQPNSPMTSGQPFDLKASRYEVIDEAVLNTEYMWMDNTVLCWVSASSTVCALSRIVYCQSWPQFGASTISRCWKPLLRIFCPAATVPPVHWPGLVLP